MYHGMNIYAFITRPHGPKEQLNSRSFASKGIHKIITLDKEIDWGLGLPRIKGLDMDINLSVNFNKSTQMLVQVLTCKIMLYSINGLES